MNTVENNMSISHGGRPEREWCNLRRWRARGAAAARHGAMPMLVACASGFLLSGCGASTNPGHSSRHADAAENLRSHISKSVDARISQTHLSAADLAQIHQQAQVHDTGVTLQNTLAELKEWRRKRRARSLRPLQAPAQPNSPRATTRLHAHAP